MICVYIYIYHKGGARTSRVTAAAVGPGAACKGAWGGGVRREPQTIKAKTTKRYAKSQFRTNFDVCFFYKVVIILRLINWIPIDFALLNTL